jgi:Domain of unknown function (DUF5615)
MRFLANENFPGDAVTQLKAAGHDIVWVRVAAPGIKDEDRGPAVCVIQSGARLEACCSATVN